MSAVDARSDIRTGERSLSAALGAGVAAAILILTLGTLGAVSWRAEPGAGLGPAEWAAVRFTLLQAGLSAAISVGLAIPVARALARRAFPGRSAVITLLGAPFILPVVVAIFGLLAVFGRSGIVSDLLGLAGFDPIRIYGLQGVVLANVFFNLPLAVRLLLQGWLAIPAERFRLAEVLGADVGRILERPMLREVAPGAVMVVFLICLTSFAVALTLGGGPGATTVELAIYQAFRFDGDLGRAALLALVQFGLSAAAAAVALFVAVPAAMGAGLDRAPVRWTKSRLDAVWIGAAVIFLGAPLVMVVLRGAGAVLELPGVVWVSAARSIGLSLVSAGLCLAAALALAVWRLRLGPRGWVVELVAALPLAASPLVMGTGLFILLFEVLNPAAAALPVTALVNAAMSLPFAVRALVPAVRAAEAGHGRLADVLGLAGWRRLRFLIVPRCRRELGFVAGLAAALSMGDLGVIALFAEPGGGTLPLEVYRLMGAYRMEAAGGAALLLLALALGVFWLLDRSGRANA